MSKIEFTQIQRFTGAIGVDGVQVPYLVTTRFSIRDNGVPRRECTYVDETLFSAFRRLGEVGAAAEWRVRFGTNLRKGGARTVGANARHHRRDRKAVRHSRRIHPIWDQVVVPIVRLASRKSLDPRVIFAMLCNQLEAQERNGHVATHECSYCLYYAFDRFGKPTEVPRFFGSRRQVVKHADAHPIGDPADMAIAVVKEGTDE